ncbi:hypothetical protein TMatcc_006009 [Talaromyces marneffei ATCC 18224]
MDLHSTGGTSFAALSCLILRSCLVHGILSLYTTIWIRHCSLLPIQYPRFDLEVYPGERLLSFFEMHWMQLIDTAFVLTAALEQ